MSNEIARFNHVTDWGMERDEDGDYVLHSDHEAEVARLRAEISALKDDPSYETACETIRKLRAELQNAAKAALDAVALSCEKEREADALRVDAMRWQHVRDMDPDAVGPAHHVVECGTDSWGNPYYEYVTGEEADQVIDAAMGASA